MRRSLSLLVAAAVAATTMSLEPAQARTAQLPAPIVTSDGASITKVGDRGHHRWKKRRHYSRYKHRRHRDRNFAQFYFPFPFIAPYAYSHAPRYKCHGRLVYGHDGRLHCVPYY